MAQSSLADLCSICYAETPKYRCPRCTTRTCSLPCYKRHQQRASCSGKRDPAAYLKKSQLATPASIDRDYNYLKGIERNIDDASVDARERGVGDTRLSSHPQGRNFKREGAFQRYLAENGISVEYAPVGMSRQKNNRSRVTKNDKIYWTIEWRDRSGELDLRHDAEHTSTLRDLYRGVQAVKRKRKAASASTGDDDASIRKKLRAVRAGAAQSQAEGELPVQDATTVDHQSVDIRPSSPTEAETTQQHSDYFYLGQRSTAASPTLLVPLDPLDTLTTALRGQAVQEYPTIYVLQEPPDRLPPGFTCERDQALHLRASAKSRAEQQSTMNTTRGGSKGANGPEREEQLDPKAILDMLKRDVKM